MVVPILLVVVGAVVLMVGSRRHWPRVIRLQGQLSRISPPNVVTQHVHFFQEGQLSVSAVKAVRARFEILLARGNPEAIETELEGGLQFLIAVRALVEIGTDDAARVLQRQLGREFSNDPNEQGWYQVDLAQALRELNHNESLPKLLQCAKQASGPPLSHLYCAELVSMPRFGDFLSQPLKNLGRCAVRVLLLALEGIRRGWVPNHIYTDAQIGELVHRLAESCPDVADPLLTRLFVEALRHRRRATQTVPDQRSEGNRREAVRWQTAFLRDAEPVLLEYLHDIGNELAHQLLTEDRNEHLDILAAITDLRVDATKSILRRISEADYPYQAQAVRCLRWSKDERAGKTLRGLARKWLSTGWGVRSWLGGSDQTKADPMISAVLFALRGHPGAETEEILLRLAQHSSPAVQLAAFQSLGWSEPLDREGVIHALWIAQRSDRPELRRAALAVQARLGECVALAVTRESLCGSDPAMTHEVIDLIVEEELTWLWPDLDLLTESEDPAIACHAWEGIERLREGLFGPLPA
jgi:hypothetical protein